jgi:DNA-binding transcriptional regulator WhiA
MPRKWTKEEEREKREELIELYVNQNKTINQIGGILSLGDATVYNRLIRLNIPVDRSRKPRCNNSKRGNIIIPKNSSKLAEFVGIMLGDGHITPTQVTVTLGTKERLYSDRIADLMEELFSVRPNIFISKLGHLVLYIGSVDLVRWFEKMGLVHNKVKEQVDVPEWLYFEEEYLKSFIRGLFDTDGSVYKLRFGVQVAFINRSIRLLESTREILKKLNYHPSKISGYKIYITRRPDLDKFFKEIRPNHEKHNRRYIMFTRES